MATPKQIMDLMKVDGLTNDEVKSHLQVGTIGYSSLSCSGSLLSRVQMVGFFNFGLGGKHW